MQQYPTLFSAIKVGPLQLKNRLIHAAITTSYAKEGVVTEALHNYCVNRAKGGAAAIVMEPMNTHAGQLDGRRPDAYNPRRFDLLEKLAAAVEQEDCRLIAQIQDNGRGRREQGRNDAAIGVSALPDDLSWTVPHVMSLDDIQRMIEQFTLSCSNLVRAGFSGVEISAGHGHLFHQFMSPWCNHRDDIYGGDLTNRTRFTRELIQSIRAECGKEFAIGLKLPGSDGIEGSIDIAEATAIASMIADTKEVDYWTFAWGSHSNTLYKHLPDSHGDHTPFMNDIRQLRQTAKHIPTGALGYITDPNEAERLLSDGSADLVMLGRPLITDPAWGLKAQAGREADIRYCVSCNTCWRMIIEANKIACDNNPRLGKEDEVDWQPVTVLAPKRITVIGAGIAGLEAAWVAAAKGHHVTVIGKSDQLGGKTLLHATLPGGENLSSIYDYQQLKAKQYGVDFKLGVTADLDIIAATKPDHVILATGSTMSWPPFLPIEYKDEGFFPDLRELMAQLNGLNQKQAGCAVIYDQDHTEMTYDAAERLADIFEQVIIVTPRERIASDVSLVARQGIYQRLSAKHVRIITLNTPLASSNFEEGELILANIYNGRETLIDQIALLTYATSRVPDDELLAPLQAQDVSVSVIGDAYAPRSVLAATREGQQTGERC
jgi:2,4-dienoyl-CoA reductase-like NADH-dependent reductase (Old Yellow Enzyme family)